MRYYGLAVVVLILDQVTKWLIKSNMELYEAIPIIGDFFQLYSHRNKGAAFGILQNQRWFFIVVTSIVVVGIVWYLQRTVRQNKVMLPTALGLLLGGALGNFIDRAAVGEVVDFLKFRFQFPWFGTQVDYTYPIFNVADIAVVVAVGLLLLDTFIDWKKEKKELMKQDA